MSTCTQRNSLHQQVEQHPPSICDLCKPHLFLQQCSPRSQPYLSPPSVFLPPPSPASFSPRSSANHQENPKNVHRINHPITNQVHPSHREPLFSPRKVNTASSPLPDSEAIKPRKGVSPQQPRNNLKVEKYGGFGDSVVIKIAKTFGFSSDETHSSRRAHLVLRHTHTHTGILCSHENTKILPFAATWLVRGDITLV